MTGKRLTRSRTEKMWGGVCGGLADYFKVDPVLVRLVWIVFTIAAFPVGLVGYIVCLVVMPEAPFGAPSTAAPSPGADAAASGADAAATAACGAAAVASPAPGAHPGMIGGLILVIIGTLLLLGNLELFDWGILRYLRWRYLWPTALIVIGIVMLLRAARPKPAR